MEFSFTNVMKLAGSIKALARRTKELSNTSMVNVTLFRLDPHRRAAAISAYNLLNQAEKMLRDVYNGLGFRAAPFDDFVKADWDQLMPEEDESPTSENKLSARLLADQLVDVTIDEALYALRLTASEKLKLVTLILNTAANLLGEPVEMTTTA